MAHPTLLTYIFTLFHKVCRVAKAPILFEEHNFALTLFEFNTSTVINLGVILDPKLKKILIYFNFIRSVLCCVRRLTEFDDSPKGEGDLAFGQGSGCPPSVEQDRALN